MFIPFGELDLGNLNAIEKKSFINYIKAELNADENVEEVNSAQLVKNGISWESLSRAADVAQIVGFMYFAGKSTPKTLRNFYEYAKKWSEKNHKHYDAEKVEKIVTFLEQGKNVSEHSAEKTKDNTL